MANKGLALIFGPGKKGMMDEEPERDESESESPEDMETDKGEVRDFAKRMLQAVKDDDEDELTAVLEEYCDYVCEEMGEGHGQEEE